MRHARTALAAFMLLAPTMAWSQGTSSYLVDPDASSLEFGVRSPVGGLSASMGFAGGTIIAGEAGQILSAEVVVDATSLSGGGIVKGRLAGRQGFDLENHPTLAFQANAVTQRGREITIGGDLTIKGVTRPATFAGTIDRSADGAMRINVSAQIDRTDFGINAGRPLYSRNATTAISLVAREAGP